MRRPGRICGVSPATRGISSTRREGLREGRPQRWPRGFAPWLRDRTWGARFASRPPSAVCMDSSRRLAGSRHAPDSYDLVAAAEGPLARGFMDMALMQDVITGPHPWSFLALRPKLDYPLTYPDIKGWKLAYDPAFLGEPDADYQRNTEAAIQRFADLGAE